MKKVALLYFVMLLTIACSNRQKTNVDDSKIQHKILNNELPTVGILVFEGVILNEVIAPLDVYSKHSKEGNSLFNVVLIGKKEGLFKSEKGLVFKADYTIENTPELKVLVVPSSYNPTKLASDSELTGFIKKQNETVDYIASHCAGAWLIAASGIADNKEIVTYIGGSEALQKAYPNVKVANDDTVAVVRDGTIFSSNGNLVSYRASLDLLEEMTNKAHRNYVAQELYLDRLAIN
ncbi:MAG: glutamine amidotransferase [Flavobacteriaceae bacterium]|nr:MAG: glutamine amidotransferase [Flavobacteriaceae bacterium]